MGNTLIRIAEELCNCVARVSEEDRKKFLPYFAPGSRVFCAGAGRSGLAVRGFAMRLMHMGLPAFVVGEMVTPSIRSGDILLVVSGSGTTASLVEMGRKAKTLGARLLLLTIKPDSPLGRLADAMICIPAPSPKAEDVTVFTSLQPMGTLAEQTAFLVLDSLVVDLMEQFRVTGEMMFQNHANLE